MSLLTLHQLECERDYRVLFTNLNLHCNEGDILQIEGPNGCGKTTLLRVLTGLSTDFKGELKWCGKPLVEVYQTVLTQLLFLGHSPGVKKTLSPRENLYWLCNVLLADQAGDAQVSVSLASIDKALCGVGLYGFENTPCHQLSAGQQQRVALARLHLSRAVLWILDEPFTAIDSQGVHDFEVLISDHARRGGCVLLTTHQNLNIEGIKRLNLMDYRPNNVHKTQVEAH
jgi:heme exporter protein A